MLWSFLPLLKSFKTQGVSFIIKGFQTIVFIFIVIFPTFRPICPPAFFRCLSNSGTYTELWTTSFIESMGVTYSDCISHNWVQVKYSCIVTHLQSGLNLQPPDGFDLKWPMKVHMQLNKETNQPRVYLKITSIRGILDNI